MANGIRGSWILEADSRWIWRMSCDVVWCIFWFCLHVWDCSMKIERLKKQEMDLELGGQEHKL